MLTIVRQKGDLYMENTRRKTSPLLILLALILAIGVLYSWSARSNDTAVFAEASDHITIGDIDIDLVSTTSTHYALQESEFMLQITSVTQVELIEPVIKLEMLHMDCGIVSSSLSADSDTSYRVAAAPLMPGKWVATASFQLKGQPDEILQLYYPFEVL